MMLVKLMLISSVSSVDVAIYKHRSSNKILKNHYTDDIDNRSFAV